MGGRAVSDPVSPDKIARDLRTEFHFERGCVFCQIVAETAPAHVVRVWDDAIAIVPLRPVTEGHTLVIPRTHVVSFYSSPEVSAATMRRAAELGHGLESWEGPFGLDANIITSIGPNATQTVKHLHVHVVPRRKDDGLALPWSPDPNKETANA